MFTGNLANWKIFEPRKLIPFSIEFCNAPIAVMTEITEKTPIVIPIIVRAERNLFAPNEVNAILIVSLNNMGSGGWGTGVMEQWSGEFCCHHHFIIHIATLQPDRGVRPSTRARILRLARLRPRRSCWRKPGREKNGWERRERLSQSRNTSNTPVPAQ